ncbi:Uncharacterised protein [Mycolicibacterium aurum]|uniref:Uncharacterized protein n=1 Tax=Mycolicibacterium aurum TaxID=1791 RepID=A0A3S4VWJ9_MYCAU|nr:hypothetical protein [Mycolicibacterium aurum]VEG57096.1 Uncharacterised protein [Mycolicibacterium aurum]
MSGQPLALDDLGYELRLLLGADEIVQFMDAQGTFGNLVNYFKDSVYLHARNLLNALTNGCATDIGTIPSAIRSEPYGRLKRSLEVYVMHIKETRNQRGVTNVRGGKHLNEYVHDLTAEVKRCWNEWIAATGDQTLAELLQAAEKSAQDDLAQLKGHLK